MKTKSTTAYGANNNTSVWLGGLHLEDFAGETTGEKIAYAAKSIKASIVSPGAYSSEGTGSDPSDAGYVPFATKDMISKAHKLGLLVKPWTVCFLGCYFMGNWLDALFVRLTGSILQSNCSIGASMALSLTIHRMSVDWSNSAESPSRQCSARGTC